MIVSQDCRACGHEFVISVDNDAYNKYLRGAMVQDCFPHLSADDRELFFISGLCGKCWDILIPEDDPDDGTYESDYIDDAIIELLKPIGFDNPTETVI